MVLPGVGPEFAGLVLCVFLLVGGVMFCVIGNSWRALVLLSALIAAGCSSDTLMPPQIPTGAELAAYAKSDFQVPYRIGATPEETLIIGIAYVDEKCSLFFDAIEEMNRRMKVGQSVLSTASNQTLTLMSTAKASALAVAEVAAAVEVTKVLLEQYQQEFAFAPHSTELRAITMAAMRAQSREFGSILQTSPRGVGPEVAVIAAVKKYAENCTLAQIREHWNTAIARAVERGVKPADGGNGSGSARAFGGGFEHPGTILGVNKYVVR